MNNGGYGSIDFITGAPIEQQEMLEDDPSAGIRLDTQEFLYRRVEDSCIEQMSGSGYMGGDVFDLYESPTSPGYSEQAVNVFDDHFHIGEALPDEFQNVRPYNEKQKWMPRKKVGGRRPSRNKWSVHDVAADLKREWSAFDQIFDSLPPGIRRDADLRSICILTRRHSSTILDDSDLLYMALHSRLPDGYRPEFYGFCERCHSASEIIVCSKCRDEMMANPRTVQEYERMIAKPENEQPSGLFDDNQTLCEMEEQDS